VVLNFAITIHFLVGLIIIALIIVHLLYLHNISSSSPFTNSSSSFSIPFFPIFFKDLFAIILLFLFCSFNFFFEVESIYGNVQNLITASAQATPQHILPEWYFLLFYSILRAFPSKTFGAILVLIFFVFII
jgi:ubiquinol-cytochrome c reductase cytochrome b subunit